MSIEKFPKLVTIKLPKNPSHDPHNKVTAPCVVSASCTDSTGEHHTTLVRTQAGLDYLRATYHITRIEAIQTIG
jgi:hypothetical protein